MLFNRIRKSLEQSTALFRHFADDTRGNLSVMLGVSMIPVVMVGGMAVDFMQAVGVKADLQAAMDGAALAGVVADVDTENERKAAALSYLAANYPDTVLSPIVTVNGDTVTVSGSAEVDTSMMVVAGINTLAPAATATAVIDPGEPICMLALDETASQAIYIHGNPEIIATGCNIQSNSNASDALYTQGTNADMTADGICAPGGYSGSGFTPTPTTCSKVEDPYASLVAPDTDGCDYSGLGQIKDPITLSPGVICGGFIAKDAVTFDPGVYVIKDGAFEVAAGGSVTGNGVFFYITGDDTGLDIKNDADLSAPTTGDYAGLLFAQDPTSNPGATTVIQGGGTIEFEGTFYLPTWHLDIGGNGLVAGMSPQVSLIANTIEIRGNGEFHVAGDEATSALPDLKPRTAGVVRLSE